MRDTRTGITRSDAKVRIHGWGRICNFLPSEWCTELPPDPENGELLAVEPPFLKGDAIDYRCDKGYGKQKSNFECSDSNLWLKGSCEPVRCQHPGEVEYAKRIGDDFWYAKRIVFKCDPDRLISHIEPIICMEDCNWSTKLPSRYAIQCPALKQIPSGTFDYISDTKVRYACRPGHRLMGDEVRTCDGQTWSGQEPSCVRLECERPEPPENGSILNPRDRYFQFDYISYDCLYGYYSDGNMFQVCIDESWNGQRPSCVLMGCNKPKPIENGFIFPLKDMCELFENVKYKCSRAVYS